MKITRKQLKILVEKYLLEQANEGHEDAVVSGRRN